MSQYPPHVILITSIWIKFWIKLCACSRVLDPGIFFLFPSGRQNIVSVLMDFDYCKYNTTLQIVNPNVSLPIDVLREMHLA